MLVISGPPHSSLVALPTEGVDRNSIFTFPHNPIRMSPSPRRAWIEIEAETDTCKAIGVALPTEGVDRNYELGDILVNNLVALPTEGVDRNVKTEPTIITLHSRPPHGGRG